MSQASALRRVIIEAMEGSLGSTRTLPFGLFGFGVFEGQNMPAQQSRSMDVRYQHQFDVVIGQSRPHRATPQSMKASYRIEARQVQIRIVTHLSTAADEMARLEQREKIEQAASDAISVLAYPGNLLTTVAGEATQIASGMLVGAEDGSGWPRYELVSEDWKKQLHTARIVGVAIVNVAQAVA
jgi:hypothetical protein